MRMKTVIGLCVAITLFLSACSSTDSAKLATTSNNSANANSATVDTGTQFGAPQLADANASHSAATDTPISANRIDQRLEEMRKAGAPGPSAEEVARKNARPAPDNSTFTSYLTDSGYEIRTFKAHPQLLKVEKKVTPDGKHSIKVFLRDGRIVDLPGQSIAVLSSAPAASILEAVGIRPAPAVPAQRNGPQQTKKSGE